MRRLSELQPVSRLRGEGWNIPATIGDEQLLRVYDTRLDHSWLARMQYELALGVSVQDTFLIGGDFLHNTALLDGEALHPGRLRRWGPAVAVAPYHVFVVPRPHQEEWMQRAHRQVGVEAMAAWVSVALVVPREKVPETLTVEAVCRAVPAVGAVLDDATLEVAVAAIGKRPVLNRLPAGEKKLPPAQWEQAHMPLSRVLVVVSFRRADGPRPAPRAQWIMGTPPRPATSMLELLRVELALPAATKQVTAEKLLRAAVRKAAERQKLTGTC